MPKQARSRDERLPLLYNARKSTLAEKSMATPVTPIQESFPPATWARARTDIGRKFPQSIAHRGYKAEHPENTLRAFTAAVEDAGAHAIETDIHLSKDDIVVLSHDPDLKRCFGKQEKIKDCTWEYLRQLRTLREPHEPMPQLRDLLEYVAQPQNLEIWILLDIKVDNDAEKVMRLIAETIASVQSVGKPWHQRVVLGIWVVKFLPLCVRYLPDFAVSHIGFPTFYARRFLQVPNLSFNMFQKALLGPPGFKIMRSIKADDRPLYLWTVNETKMMKWGIQNEADGVITDDPKRFNQICNEWSEDEPVIRASLVQWLYSLWLSFVFRVLYFLPFRILFFSPLRHKYPETVEAFIKSEHERRSRVTPAFEA